MELIAQIALGVIIGGLTIALFVTGFFVWNSRQKNEIDGRGKLAERIEVEFGPFRPACIA
jgi:hypothetical protein